MSEPRSLEDWLRLAFARDEACPPPEGFYAAAVGDLDEAEAGTLERHAQRCRACAAERALALMFAAAPDDASADRAAQDAIVRRLEGLGSARGSAAAIPEEAAGSPLPRRSPEAAEPTPSRPRRADAGSEIERMPRRPQPIWWERPFETARALPAWGLAAAALIIVIVGAVVVQLRARPPVLPDPTTTTLRGARLAIDFPEGDLPSGPEVLRWDPARGADIYRVTLRGAADLVLWQARVKDTEAFLPPEIRDAIRPFATYTWDVEAVDAAGARVATSGRIAFRVVSPGTDGSPEASEPSASSEHSPLRLLGHRELETRFKKSVPARQA